MNVHSQRICAWMGSISTPIPAVYLQTAAYPAGVR